jgi:hypothetical protein
MAQQTINIGTAPNDGTGTPLRTSFDYCNLNFTELYTAVGPSGNNIVVPGTATISGDLTVRTAGLTVNANGVGVGVVGTLGAGNIQIGAGKYLGYSATAYITPEDNVQGARIKAGVVLIDAGFTAGFNIGGSTAMTLNSTGLGVGGSPITKFFVQDATLTGTSQIREQVIRAASDNTNNSFNSLVGFTFSASSAAYSAGSLVRSSGVYGINLDNTAFGRVMGLSFYTCAQDAAATEKMRIDSSGNVGVGVTPSAWQSSVKALQVGTQSAAWQYVSQLFVSNNRYFDGANKYIANGYSLSYVQNPTTGTHEWFYSTNNSSGAGAALSPISGMSLDASGNLLVGTTSALIASSRRLSVVGTVAAALQSTGAATVETVNVWHTATTGNNIFIDFDTEASVTSRGSISYNRSGGLVAYNTTSDYRAKDIIGPVSNSGSVIDSLKVYIGKMKGASVERPMLVAHEAQTVAPYAVTGEKDAVDVDGNPRYQQMDVSSFVPLLIAEIQSLRARVQTLEAR